MLKSIRLFGYTVLIILNSNCLFSQTEPSEYLKICFKDASNSRDTIIVGYFYDTCIVNKNCPAIVSLGIDPAFNEKNEPSLSSQFAARSEVKKNEGFPENLFLRKDIRFNEPPCNMDINSQPFKIRFYNATFPIIAETIIFRDSMYSKKNSENRNFGCFTNKAPFVSGPGWLRATYDKTGQIKYISGYYDEDNHSNLTDTLCCNNFDYYGVFSGVSTGITENRKILSLKILPNPVRDLLRLQIPLPENQNKTITIYSIQGCVTKEIITEDNEINVADLVPGVYYLKLKTIAKGTYFQKFIKVDL